MSPPHEHFVLVPGAWHGEWVWDAVAVPLARRNCNVFPVTLAGLEPPAWPDHLRPAQPPNLDDHIGELVDMVRALAPVRFVLVGQGYGGIVITGVADRIPEQVARLIYVNAYVPADGDSCWSLAGERVRRLLVDGAAADGRWVGPPPGYDPRSRPHPFPSLVQRLRIGPGPRVPRTYVAATGPGRATGGEQRDRADPAWRVVELPYDHDVLTRAPDTLVDVLTAAPEE